MAMSKGFRVLEKSKPPSPHSILLEHRNKSDALLFESQAVAVLCKGIDTIIVYQIHFLKSLLRYSGSRD